jgi:hypothetical protein
MVRVPVQDFQPIEQRGRFAFGETDTFYGVWDRRAGTVLVEQFPLTDEGFERASALFDQLKRRDRSERGVLLYVLWSVMVLGALTMIAGSAMELVGHVFGVEAFLGTLLPYSLSTLGYTVTLGGLALLAGLTLVRRETRRRLATSPAAIDTADPSQKERPGILWWVLVVSLGVWVGSSIATQFVFPQEFTGRAPRTATLISMTVESFAFRVWVATLAIWWGRRLLSRRRDETVAAPE